MSVLPGERQSERVGGAAAAVTGQLQVYACVCVCVCLSLSHRVRVIFSQKINKFRRFANWEQTHIHNWLEKRDGQRTRKGAKANDRKKCQCLLFCFLLVWFKFWFYFNFTRSLLYHFHLIMTAFPFPFCCVLFLFFFSAHLHYQLRTYKITRDTLWRVASHYFSVFIALFASLQFEWPKTATKRKQNKISFYLHVRICVCVCR